MDTRRRAPESGKLTPGVASAAFPSGAQPLPRSSFRQPSDRDGLVQRTAEALEANLKRGFLESEENLRYIAETLDHIVFLTDAGLTAVHFVNAAYERVWGRTRADLYRDPLSFLAGVHADDRERVREALTVRADAGYDIEFRIVRPDGDERWLRTRGFPIRDADGTVTRIAGMAEDTTDYKRIRASHEQLMRGFTHDVKNPLGAADGHLALLAEGVYGELSRTQRESVDRARRSIHTALGLITQMLDIERAQSGTIELHRQRFDLGAALRDLIGEYRPVANARRIALSLEIPRDDPEALVLYSDPERVRQVIGNLVSNAVKYTQEGGRCAVEVRLVDATDTPPLGPWVAIEVSDNGPGIPLEKQHLLFREFTRFSPGAADGSGIGLAISQQLARALDAKITFESTVGVGSVFTFWVPRDRRIPSPQQLVGAPERCAPPGVG